MFDNAVTTWRRAFCERGYAMDFSGRVTVGKAFLAEQWPAWVGEQRESELNLAEFCEWIGVSLNSIYRWRPRLAAKGKSSAVKGP